MYKCEKCSRVFEDPYEIRDYDTGHVDSYCPHCHWDRFEEVHECPVCRAEFTAEDFCEDCIETTKNALLSLKTRLNASDADFADIVSACLE